MSSEKNFSCSISKRFLYIHLEAKILPLIGYKNTHKSWIFLKPKFQLTYPLHIIGEKAIVYKFPNKSGRSSTLQRNFPFIPALSSELFRLPSQVRLLHPISVRSKSLLSSTRKCIPKRITPTHPGISWDYLNPGNKQRRGRLPPAPPLIVWSLSSALRILGCVFGTCQMQPPLRKGNRHIARRMDKGDRSGSGHRFP